MAQAHVGYVHGATFAAAVTGLAAGDLSHHPVGVCAPGQEDAVPTVVRGEAVAVLHGRPDASRRALLPHGEVKHRAGRSALEEQLADTLLEAPDPDHHLEQALLCVSWQLLHSFQVPASAVRSPHR